MQDITTTIAEAIISRIDLDHLARRIADHLRDAPAAAATHYDPNAPYPVTAIRRELGRPGRPMAHLTFQKNYLQTGILKLIPGPNRRQLYVRAGDWQRLKTETKTKK